MCVTKNIGGGDIETEPVYSTWKWTGGTPFINLKILIQMFYTIIGILWIGLTLWAHYKVYNMNTRDQSGEVHLVLVLLTLPIIIGHIYCGPVWLGLVWAALAFVDWLGGLVTCWLHDQVKAGVMTEQDLDAFDNPKKS